MIYLDNAATTRMKDEVLEEMLPFFTENYGNASTIYSIGTKSRKAIAGARDQVAALIGAKSEEIFFTSGGSEADNWALRGIVEAAEKKNPHIITTNIEHHAILHTCQALEKQGVRVSYVPVSREGIVDVEAIRREICADTLLISVMMANNEIGTLQPMEEIAAIAHEKGILIHTDAVQTVGQIPVDVNQLQVDLLSVSAHKFGGPKGVGCLFIRKGTKIAPLIAGGAQERGRRAGTENVPGIVGFGMAAFLALDNLKTKMEREAHLRNHMLERLQQEIPLLQVNGSMEKRLPGNLNITIPFVEGETMLILLDRKGICASSGSACTTGAIDPSHVLMAIGHDKDSARGSLRFTLSDETTQEEVEAAVDNLVEIVQHLREMSPQYQSYKKSEMR